MSEKETSLCVPILVQGETAGVLVLLPNPDVPPVRGDRLGNTVARIRRVGTAVAEQMALTLNNLQVRAALRAQAIRDPLTGLFNRRYLEETLERELHTPSAETAPFLS